MCSSDRFYCESGLLFLRDSLRVLLEAQLVLLGIWVAELMSFICTLAWDDVSAGLSHLEAPLSQQQSALALGSSELHVKIRGFLL